MDNTSTESETSFMPYTYIDIEIAVLLIQKQLGLA